MGPVTVNGVARGQSEMLEGRGPASAAGRSS
jgi:hypothetical protein